MKKIVLLLFLVLTITGCTIVRIKTDNIDTILNVILSKENNLYNTTGKGYKYYRPAGVTHIDTNEYNEKLYSSGNYYYLYVDIVSYYYKKESEYLEDDNLYFSRKLDFNGKTGYLEITEQKGQYLIEYLYNYSKIESLVDKEDINKVVLDATYILSSLKYNGDVIKIELSEEFLTNQEEQYDKFENSGEYNFTKEEE